MIYEDFFSGWGRVALAEKYGLTLTQVNSEIRLGRKKKMKELKYLALLFVRSFPHSLPNNFADLAIQWQGCWGYLLVNITKGSLIATIGMTIEEVSEWIKSNISQ